MIKSTGRKTINAIKQFFGGTEHELEYAEVKGTREYHEHIISSEIDVAEYRYNHFDAFESPVMCGICGDTPAKYQVTTTPPDGPPYSHDYCAKCFIGPLAKEQIDANDHRV